MKKMISILVVVAMMAAMLVSTVSAEEAKPQLVVSSATAAVGEKVTLEVSIVNNPGISNGKLDVTFDAAALKLVEIIFYEETEDDEIEYILGKLNGMNNGASINFSAGRNNTKDGIMFKAVFEVLENASGDVAVSLDVDYIDGDTLDIAFEVVAGKVTVDAPVHTCAPVDVAEVPATCTAEGTKAHQKCACGKLYVDGKEVTAADLVIEKTAHEMGEWTQTKAPTETEKGEESRKCKNCDYTETREVEVLAHTCAPVDVAEAPATCTAEGTKAHQKCECGKLYVDGKEVTAADLVIEKTAHEMGEWTQTKAPTETEKGEESRKCKNCDYTETREVEVLAHTCAPVDVAEVPATCTTEGTKAHQKCECGKLYVDGKEVTAADLVIPMLGHTFVDGVCSVCGEADQNVPPTGDVFTLMFTLVAASGMGLVALTKKKED